jgi:hypothetical protein
MKFFKISIITLVAFGWVHFLADKLLVRWMSLETYLDVKFWIGKVTLLLTIFVVSSLLWMLIKFLIQKKDA